MKSKKSLPKTKFVDINPRSIKRIAIYTSLLVALLVCLGSIYTVYSSGLSGLSLKDTIRNSIQQRQQYIDEITSPNVNYESHRLGTQNPSPPE